MRLLLFFWICFGTLSTVCGQHLDSAIYPYATASVSRQGRAEERILLQGSTSHLANLTVQAITLQPGKNTQLAEQLEEEVILYVQAGELSMSLGPKEKALGRGSVAMIVPGDEFRLTNKSPQPTTYYLIRYTSNEMPDLDLTSMAGSSFWVDFQDKKDKVDKIGSTRAMFSCATVMSPRIDTYFQSLNPGIKSISPFRPEAEKLLIMVENQAQLIIKGKTKVAMPGDAVFLDTGISHTIQNTGSAATTFLVIQLQ